MADMNVLDSLIEQRIPEVHKQFNKYNGKILNFSLFEKNFNFTKCSQYFIICSKLVYEWIY